MFHKIYISIFILSSYFYNKLKVKKMKGRSYSVIGSRIKMQPSHQEMLITKVHNLTYDVKYMKELVKV